jgi:hypothetical protein
MLQIFIHILLGCMEVSQTADEVMLTKQNPHATTNSKVDM